MYSESLSSRVRICEQTPPLSTLQDADRVNRIKVTSFKVGTN